MVCEIRRRLDGRSANVPVHRPDELIGWTFNVSVEFTLCFLYISVGGRLASRLVDLAYMTNTRNAKAIAAAIVTRRGSSLTPNATASPSRPKR